MEIIQTCSFCSDEARHEIVEWLAEQAHLARPVAPCLSQVLASLAVLLFLGDADALHQVQETSTALARKPAQVARQILMGEHVADEDLGEDD